MKLSIDDIEYPDYVDLRTQNFSSKLYEERTMKARTAVSWFTANKVWTIPLVCLVAGIIIGAVIF